MDPEELIVAEHRKRAEAAFPGLRVPAGRFEAFLREKSDEGPFASLDEALAQLRTQDLYLVCAVVEGVPGAVAAMEASFMSGLDPVIQKLAGRRLPCDEVKQRIRESLLVARPGERPRVASYSGRGELRSWLRSVAVRTTLKLLRDQGRRPAEGPEALVALVDDTDDPELRHLKRAHARDFKEALREALLALPPRERLLLKQHYLDGLSIDRLGELHGVHRATAARWLAAARERLHDDTRRRLMERVPVAASEFGSLVRLVQSQLEISLVRILDDGAVPDPTAEPY